MLQGLVGDTFLGFDLEVSMNAEIYCEINIQDQYGLGAKYFFRVKKKSLCLTAIFFQFGTKQITKSILK